MICGPDYRLARCVTERPLLSYFALEHVGQGEHMPPLPRKSCPSSLRVGDLHLAT